MPRKKLVKTIPQKDTLIAQEEENNSQEEESLQLLCQKIREARIANKLSLESVSGHLHIGVKTLEAIEEGMPKNGPTPVFFRGLVRTYCQFLELDKTKIIDKIDKLLKIEDPDKKINTKALRPVFKTRDSHPLRNAISILVILLGGYLIYSQYFVEEQITLADDNNSQAVISGVEVQVEKEPTQTIPQTIQDDLIVTDSLNEKTEETIEALIVTEEPIKLSVTDETQTEVLESSQTESVQVPVEPLTLEVEASEGTWVSISVDGKDTEDYRIEVDEIQQWEAKEKYLLTLGNSRVVRVLLNGREIETNRTNQLLTNWLVDSSFLP